MAFTDIPESLDLGTVSIRVIVIGLLISGMVYNNKLIAIFESPEHSLSYSVVQTVLISLAIFGTLIIVIWHIWLILTKVFNHGFLEYTF